MKVLFVHNYYQHTGGEDVVVARERDLLTAHGHEVRLYSKSNKAINGTWDKIRVAWSMPYSGSSRRSVATEINAFRPDLVHVHNFFPLLTPSIYDACCAASVPVIQSLHNYRLLCLNGALYRDEHICEDCLGKAVPWPGVLHACYRRDRRASGAVAAMLTLHRLLRTWVEKVDMYIALTEFAREKFIQGGLPAGKIAVKPNFACPDPGCGDGRGGYALFVGRLAPDKGVRTMLACWDRLGGKVPLKIVGSGPLVDQVLAATESVRGVEWLGWQPLERVLALMKGARFLVLPSTWYESFPVVIAEAFAAGLPVIASNVGSLSSLIAHGCTGLHFRQGDPVDLAAQVWWLWNHPRARDEMAHKARLEFECKYTPERNYGRLMEIYTRATEAVRKGRLVRPVTSTV